MFLHLPRRIPSEDSLTNPSQHVTYAYTDSYYQCDCPSNDEFKSLTHNLEYSYKGYYYYKHITGAVRCSQSIPCSEEHTGLTWHGSQLQPVVQVDYVGISVEHNGITCEFTPIKNKKHIVRW
ncbi:hypothetical protein DPMN_096378 [Dreissena polymorpha]|uniref:Uncharacterized protein n=1 Tax=Dreissena polymorpha TaxID=45954 RepID=A0A9D4L7N3_DREPO|nr:hypothetical protein DPMN_095271 [Dreissena polymorpha]KAH3853843.1 hypothetical protein DPMN_096378 [Dreissena polymorpha]